MRPITAAIAAATATAIVVSSSFAIAAIPNSATKVITVCYTKTSGALRLIDKQAGKACNTKTELELSWNQQGVKGDIGLTGAPGVAGIKGDPGTPGVNGLPGVKGDAGTNGLPGAKGDPGVPGSNGLDGAPGAPGPAGTAGTNGTNGVDGTPGAKGDPGLPGANGVDGAQGIPGPGLKTVAGRLLFSNGTITAVGPGFSASFRPCNGGLYACLMVDFPDGTWGTAGFAVVTSRLEMDMRVDVARSPSAPNHLEIFDFTRLDGTTEIDFTAISLG